MIWLGIIIGIAIMQLISVIVMLVTKEDDYICKSASIFLIVPFIWAVQKILQKNRQRKARKMLQQENAKKRRNNNG